VRLITMNRAAAIAAANPLHRIRSKDFIEKSPSSLKAVSGKEPMSQPKPNAYFNRLFANATRRADRGHSILLALHHNYR
jgi:hypothetical protein